MLVLEQVNQMYDIISALSLTVPVWGLLFCAAWGLISYYVGMKGY